MTKNTKIRKKLSPYPIKLDKNTKIPNKLSPYPIKLNHLTLSNHSHPNSYTHNLICPSTPSGPHPLTNSYFLPFIPVTEYNIYTYKAT